jgi:hypothetical protein
MQKTTTASLAITIAVTASATIALAQPAPPASGDPALGPGFVTTDRLDASSRAGIQVSYLSFNEEEGEDINATILRFEAHARYVHAPTRLGGYVQVPFVYAQDDDIDGGEALTDFGNIEIGGLYAPRLSTPGVGVILRAGITLPTGETGEEALVGTVANFIALPQIYNSLPEATTIKLGASPVLRSGVAFARLDLGVDWNIDVDGGSVGAAIHYNAGAGVELGKVALALESQNVTIMDSDDTSDDGETLNAMALTARADLGTALPYAALIVPLDDGISELFDFALTVGLDVRLP